jgi:hypothetical protein
MNSFKLATGIWAMFFTLFMYAAPAMAENHYSADKYGDIKYIVFDSRKMMDKETIAATKSIANSDGYSDAQEEHQRNVSRALLLVLLGEGFFIVIALVFIISQAIKKKRMIDDDELLKMEREIKEE